MSLPDFAKRQTVPLSPAQHLPNRAVDAGRQQSRAEIVAEVGKTMLILILMGLGIVVLRYVLVLLHGFLN
jgi:hypothetical protein